MEIRLENSGKNGVFQRYNFKLSENTDNNKSIVHCAEAGLLIQGKAQLKVARGLKK